MDESFKVLQRKEVYELLDGSANDNLVEIDGQPYGMPYLTTTELSSICGAFGVFDVQGSRWNYVEALLQYAILNDRCSEVLSYFLSLEHFNYLNSLEDLDIIEKIHKEIVSAVITRINYLIRLTKKELVYINGNFYIRDAGEEIIIDAPKVDIIDMPYIRGLRERCEEDLITGNYDSVITKSRTLIEETLIYILENNNVTPVTSGKVRELYNQVKELRNMKQNSAFDNRINGLLSGLERIVTNI